LEKSSWKLVNGAKEFHLIPMAVQRKFLSGYKVNVYGYNGSMLGPTIKVSQGDRVRIISPVDRDFDLIFQNFFIDSNQTTADSWRMDWNWNTINGRNGPYTTRLVCKHDEKV